jgi:hypothetical protein
MGQWREIPLARKLFKNVGENSLTSAYAALENCFVTEAGGVSRFPALKDFADIDGESDIYINKYRNDMISVGQDGAVHRIDQNANVERIDGVPVLGGRRCTFGRSSSALYMAAGDQIIRFDGEKTSVLSKDAPLTTHVGVIDNYVMAIEAGSGRFHHSDANAPTVWSPLNVFAADGRGDDLTSMLINPFNEILMAGEESIEQFERYAGGTTPFFRRWSIADGISEPYTLCFSDNSAWGLNEDIEFVRIGGQTSQDVSQDVSKEFQARYSLGHLSSLNRAWAHEIKIKGQKFVLLQSPEASNEYGGKGVTYCFDVRQGRWFQIYGWDDTKGVPALWAGRSVFKMWGKTFVGGQGKIYELDTNTYRNDGQVQRVYARTAHFAEALPSRIDRVRVHLERGVGTHSAQSTIVMRVNKDGKGFGRGQYMNLGKAGDNEMVLELGAQGIADTWQFEFSCTDDTAFEMRKFRIEVTGMPR